LLIASERKASLLRGRSFCLTAHGVTIEAGKIQAVRKGANILVYIKADATSVKDQVTTESREVDDYKAQSKYPPGERTTGWSMAKHHYYSGFLEIFCVWCLSNQQANQLLIKS